jgi:pectate lyase
VNAIDHILHAQYATGGWPQLDPPGKNYHRYITFNDDVMINLMELLREVGSSDRFALVDDARRQKARAAFDAGVACILKCQIVVDGKKTVWCAQHDETTLEPRPARTFEPASLSGSESAGILILLMSLEQPSPEVVAAVEAGARWFEVVKITGVRQSRIDGDKVITADPAAPPLWARFYEIRTNRPIFCSRDGVVRYSMAEISAERRNGYGWYGDRGARMLRRYAKWAIENGRMKPAKP